MTTSKSLDQFIKEHGLRMTVAQVDRNPNMEGSADTMDNWRCTIFNRNKKRFTVYFSKGVGHGGAEPALPEVLDCLAADSVGIENNSSFEDWCGEYGYDTDSRKAEKTYKACETQAEKLKALLGPTAFRELLYDVERM